MNNNILIIGVHEARLDEKGRFSFPAALKKQLEQHIAQGFIIKRSIFYPCLELYLMLTWEKEMQLLSKLNRFVKKNNDFIRLFLAGSRQVILDDNGRLLIPRDLIQYAHLNRDIVLASSLDRIEIWNKDEYENFLYQKSSDFGSLSEEVMGNIQNIES
ncbi:MAG: division/cell wall cluster transcriptional repressor MraZ [Bacteroidales bacterium]|nr:division/cell wall cluster transcriptional repressor MraZ [Bacteroidales bacterium]